MQQVTQATQNLIENTVRYDLFSRVRLDVEVNGYKDYTLTFPESLEPTMFPESSVMRVRRPDGGLPKTIAGEAKAISTEISDLCYSKDRNFYRAPSKDSNYKYYRSNSVSSEALSTDRYLFASPLEFIVEYASEIRLNKIVLGMEYANSLPKDCEIQIFKNSSWTSIGTFEPTPDGKVIVSYDGSWSESDGYSYDFDQIDGIKVIVDGMQDPDAAVEIIQISPRISIDISDRIVENSTTKSSSEYNIVNPVGISSSNSYSARIANEDGFFNNSNQESALYEVIDVNIKFTVHDIVQDENTTEYIPQIVAFANSWNYDSTGTVSIDASDRSKFLQSRSSENSFYQNEDIRFVISDILERSEITNYEICYSQSDLDAQSDYFFFLDDQTVWEVLQSIASAEQSVFYFDESDRLVWQSRDYLWGSEDVDYEILASSDGTKLPNLVEYSIEFSNLVNKITVNYVPTEILKRGDKLVNNFLWTSENSEILMSSALQSNIDDNSTYFVIDSEYYQFYPEEGFVNIEAEYIKYTKTAPDEQTYPDNTLFIVERGAFNSTKDDHYFDSDVPGSTVSTVSGATPVQISTQPTLAAYHFIDDSNLKLRTNVPDSTLIYHYYPNSTGTYDIYGTRLRLPATITDENISYDAQGISGIFINKTSAGSGYYIELVNTLYIQETESLKRETRIWKYEDGKRRIISGFFPEDLVYSDINELFEASGAKIYVIPDKDYDVNVFTSYGNEFFEYDGGSGNVDYIQITVEINGRKILSVKDYDYVGNTIYTSGDWGVYARSDTHVDFEYVYAINRGGDESELAKAQIAIRDQISGGFIDNTLEHFLSEHNQLRNDFFFDDFGSWAREIREYNVVYEINPAISADLFISNESDSYLVYKNLDQFSGNFAVGNRRRKPLVLSGDDQNLGASMIMAVYGVPLIQSQRNDVKKSNDNSVWRRGEEEIIVESPWIQSKEKAERISDWAVQRWSSPSETINVTAACDPRIQIGDLATISIPENHITPETHKFHVVGVSKTVGESASMSVTLRRAHY